MKKMKVLLVACALACAFVTGASAADKPNILIIWGDDIGWFNPSCYNSGMMGRAPRRHCDRLILAPC